MQTDEQKLNIVGAAAQLLLEHEAPLQLQTTDDGGPVVPNELDPTLYLALLSARTAAIGLAQDRTRSFEDRLALVLLLCAVPLPVHAAANEITVYNWGQYISDGTDDSLDVIKAFEEETGIKVNYLTFDSNESMYTKLKTGGTTFDVIIPSDYMIAKLISEDMLEPLDFANIPNYEYIDEAFRNQAYDPENTSSVPYTWGTVGLIYNKNYVSDEDAESWSCLWNSKYAGKLLMFDNPRDAFAIAESMLGYSLNTEDENELRQAADALEQMCPAHLWPMPTYGELLYGV